jgi:hypothetical protein
VLRSPVPGQRHLVAIEPDGASFPEGWEVETSDAAGTWSRSFDEEAGLPSVTMPDTGGTHTICVRPAGSPSGCAGTPPAQEDPPAPPSGGSGRGDLPEAAPALPVAGNPTYAG